MTIPQPATLSDVLTRIRTRCLAQKRPLFSLVPVHATSKPHTLDSLLAAVSAVPGHDRKTWTLEKVGSREAICQAGETGESEPVFYLP